MAGHGKARLGAARCRNQLGGARLERGLAFIAALLAAASLFTFSRRASRTLRALRQPDAKNSVLENRETEGWRAHAWDSAEPAGPAGPPPVAREVAGGPTQRDATQRASRCFRPNAAPTGYQATSDISCTPLHRSKRQATKTTQRACPKNTDFLKMYNLSDRTHLCCFFLSPFEDKRKLPLTLKKSISHLTYSSKKMWFSWNPPARGDATPSTPHCRTRT